MNNFNKKEYLDENKVIKKIGRVVDENADYHIMGKTASGDYVCIISASTHTLSEDD